MQETNINLNLNDLKNVVNVIDYAAAQGAFKGWDTIKQVMEVREKVAIFLQAAEAVEQQKTQAAQAAQDAQPSSELEISYEDSEETAKDAKPKKKVEKK